MTRKYTKNACWKYSPKYSLENSKATLVEYSFIMSYTQINYSKLFPLNALKFLRKRYYDAKCYEDLTKKHTNQIIIQDHTFGVQFDNKTITNSY
jgi:hypothetical protein